MFKTYTASMQRDNYDDNFLRLSVYGLADRDIRDNFKDYRIFSIREDIFISTKTETRTLNVTFELIKESEIN